MGREGISLSDVRVCPRTRRYGYGRTQQAFERDHMRQLDKLYRFPVNVHLYARLCDDARFLSVRRARAANCQMTCT